MKKKHKKYLTYAIIIIAIVSSFFIFKTPDYPDTITPKPIQGNPDADIKIVEFADFQCPACAQAHPIMKQIIEEFGDDISYEFRHFPLSRIHPHADRAAQASECANDQGKFLEYADLLFANQNSLQDNFLRQYAEELNLDMDMFKTCLRSGKKQAIVNGDLRQGQSKGVRGTPSIFLNGRPVQSWQYESLRSEILNELQ